MKPKIFEVKSAKILTISFSILFIDFSLDLLSMYILTVFSLSSGEDNRDIIIMELLLDMFYCKKGILCIQTKNVVKALSKMKFSYSYDS